MNYIQGTQLNMRQEQAAETRQKLLATAKTLFAENGYNGTSVRSINRSLNMADGILYHHFPGGKREILSVLMAEGFSERMRKSAEFNSDLENLSLSEALEKIYIICNELFTDDLELMKILFRESDIMEFKETSQLSSLYNERRKWITGFLNKRYEKGEIRNMDFEMAAEKFMAMGILNIISKMTKIDFSGQLSEDDYRKQLINHTIDLWKVD